MRRPLLLVFCFVFILLSGSLCQQTMRFPLGQIWGHLRVVIVDQPTGREVPARCYLTNAAGESWAPSGALTYVKPPERNFIAPGRFQIELPTGTYSLRVERGTEYRAENRQIEIRAGDILDEKIALNRWVDMNTRGWYSGDLHNHRNWEEMGTILLSEDLNLSPTITDWVLGDHTISIMPARKSGESGIRRADATHVYSIFDTEIERISPTGPGAVDLVGLKSPVDFQGYDLFPPHYRVHRGSPQTRWLCRRGEDHLASQRSAGGTGPGGFRRSGLQQLQPLRCRGTKAKRRGAPNHGSLLPAPQLRLQVASFSGNRLGGEADPAGL